jgi:hypothetical protein
MQANKKGLGSGFPILTTKKSGDEKIWRPKNQHAAGIDKRTLARLPQTPVAAAGGRTNTKGGPLWSALRS